MSTENTNENEIITGDEMFDAYLESQGWKEQQENKSDDKTPEQIAAEEEAANKEKSDQEEQQRIADEEAESNRQEQERIKAEQEQSKEKPKKWDEGLDEKAKYVLDKLSKGEEKDVYELLRNKYAYDNLSDDEKIMTYLKETNPHLDSEDLAFKAANEYGLGVDPISEDELTTEQKNEIRRQSIERKTLLKSANDFFEEKKVNLNIPSLPNPLDEDEEYAAYKKAKEEQVEVEKQNELNRIEEQKELEKITNTVNETAKNLETLPLEFKINLDQGELDLKTDFKLDDAKQKQLAEYALEYTPTAAEVKAHQNQNGELDMKGYMTTLAKRLFAEQILKNAVKIAIGKDRDSFTENELKNSTLRNNSGEGAAHEEPFDIYTAAMGN